MRRKLIIGERIMYVDASTAVNCVFTARIRGSFSLEQLRLALYKIQQKHPLLRASIKEDSMGVPYFVSSNAIDSIPVRIAERSSDEHWKLESKREWHKLFDGKNKPMARVVWLKDVEVSELMLICPHCICDGTTLITLMRELLTLLDKPEQVLSSYLPFVSVEGLLSKSYSGKPGKFLKAKLLSVFAGLFFLIKSGKRPESAGASYLLHYRIDPEKTAALTAVCRTEGVTVHAALCVAFLDAFKSALAGQAKGKVICPVDIRRFVPEIRQDHMFAFAPIAELSAGTATDFWDKARKISQDMNAKIELMDVADLLLMSEYFHSSAGRMVNYLRTATGSHDLTLSNMGRLAIPDDFETFSVEAIYSPTVAFPWRNPNTLTISTYNGIMDFCLSSNESFLPEELGKDMMKQALGLLVQPKQYV